MTISNYFESQLLKALKNESPAVAAVYVKLHTGDPGEEATSNAATETTRKAITFGSISSGTVKNSGSIEWTAVAATETIKYISLWDASTSGNPLWSGALETEKALTAGDTLKFNTETITVSLD